MNNIKTYLTEAYAIDDKSILRILTQNKQINKADPDYSYYEKLANWANSSGKQQKLKNIDLNTIKLSDKGLIEKRKLITRYTTLGHLLLALKNLMDQEGKYTPSSELSKLIQQTTLDILVGLSDIPNNKKLPEKPEEAENEEKSAAEENANEEDPEADNAENNDKLRKGVDWTAEKAKRLANAKEPTSEVLNKFYNDYYNIEYAGGDFDTAGDASIVAKLKSLDKILVPEFNKLGYNPEVNPFAQFLKTLIKLRAENRASNIFDKLNTNNYGAIHNSFIDKYITGNMLGKYDKESENILFCSDLYNHKGLDIVKYLSLQSQVIKEQVKSDYAADKQLIAKIFMQQDIEGENYSEKVDKLLDEKQIKSTNDNNAKLRSILEIQELYRYIFGHEAEDTSEIDQIIKETIAKKAVLDMLYCITMQAKIEDTDKEAVVEWLREVGYEKAEEQITECKRILLGHTIGKTTAIKIINKLVKYFNKNIRKEEADK